MNKQERRNYIAAIAQRMQEERAIEQEIMALEQDNDVLSIENIDGFVTTGLQKIAGGFRKLPIIIL